jgi:Tol biopolymer transport system component
LTLALEPGQMLSHYRLVEKIGEGGMGVVWKATDTTLDRDVAIKILPDAFVAETERIARFEREARLLASLDHPGIAAVYGLHLVDGVRFLAMEYVPGEDLAARLSHGPLPVEDAIDIARRVAEALEAAHEQHVIHRDIKPANVVLRPDGAVKVLDFGLAKALSPDGVDGSDNALSMSPTMTAATVAGVVLGTASYMSPEQARGRPVDRRTDIWALGCLLYEMLTAQRLFTGETVSDVMAAVLRADIDLAELPGETPATVRSLLARCLDRDPRTRLQDAGEARIVLAAPGVADEADEPRRERGMIWIAAAAAVALVAGIGVGRLVLTSPPPPQQNLALQVSVPDRETVTGSFALSPDGTKLVFLTRREGGEPDLWLRSLGGFDARPLPGTAGARFPFWAPDGTEIAFFADGVLSRIALDGSSPRRVAKAIDPHGGTWSQSGVILFGTETGVFNVRASGGAQPVAVTEVDEEAENAHIWPVFLPDGRRFVFLTDSATDEGHRVRLADLDGGETRTLLTVIRSNLGIDPAGFLLLIQESQLMAYRMDMDSGALSGDPVFVANEIHPLGARHQAPFAVSASGALAYQHGSAIVELVHLDLDGASQGVIDTGRFGSPVLSPDGRRLAFEEERSAGEWLIWVHDLERGVRTLLSERGVRSGSPAWGPRGDTIYYNSFVGDEWTALREPAGGGGAVESLGAPPELLETGEFYLLDCSPDGRWLLASAEIKGEGMNLFLYPLDDDSTGWIPWRGGPASQSNGAFSADSSWIVFTSSTSGREEVYLAPVEAGGGDRLRQISAGGGNEPRFSADGTRIYYRSSEEDLVAVEVELSEDGATAGPPEVQFAVRLPLELGYWRNTFDVAPDHKSFVAIRATETGDRSIRVRTRWRAALD